MAINNFEGGTWSLRVEGEPVDLALSLCFRNGAIFEGSLQNGHYVMLGNVVIAMIGEDLVLTITGRYCPKSDRLRAELMTLGGEAPGVRLDSAWLVQDQR